MKGQWVGGYTSDSSTGTILVDIDQVDTFYLGYVVLRPLDRNLPPTFAAFHTTDLSEHFTVEAELLPYNPVTYDPEPWTAVEQFWPNAKHAKTARANFELREGKLGISWTDDLGSSGTTALSPSQADQPSTYIAEESVGDWDSFRERLRVIEPYKYIFRGQQNSLWRLRTSFHRTGRANFIRYYRQDVQTIHKYLSPRTRHSFDLTKPLDYGAFISLIQHHGFPTPLLDWTHSPFVAAYFAFRGISNRDAIAADPRAKIRIFMFSRSEWINDQPQLLKLAPLHPHFSLIDPLAIENPRMIPQQALSSITNVDDIESYLQFMEYKNKRYLRVFDIPVSERTQVIKELSLMGITAGSLFPGIDGVCEELRERFYGEL